MVKEDKEDNVVMDLAPLIYSVENSPVIKKDNGYEYFIHPLADGIPEISPVMLSEAAMAFIMMGGLKDVEFDKIVTIEAMGIPIATALSILTGRPLTIIRKRSYGLSDEEVVEYETGYSANKLYINGIEKGEKVLVVDDVLSTGNTMINVIKSLHLLGAEVVRSFVLFSKEKDDEIAKFIKQKYDVYVIRLFEIEIVEGKVNIKNFKQDVVLDDE